MNIKLIAYGIAKEILNSAVINFQVSEEADIAELKSSLIAKYPAFEKLRSLRFAVNEDYQKDSYRIHPNDEVVIIPPVSGG